MDLTVGIGLLGCGTVGASVADRLVRDRPAIEARSGVRYQLRNVAIRDYQKARPSSLASRLFTRDARAVVDDSQVDLVVELIGGTMDATELVERALDNRKHVVTANKDLLATQRPRLAAIAASRGTTLRFEGAVAGAVPITRVLDDSLAGDWVESIAGVLNGTCTYILSRLEDGCTYDEALAAARRAGYAEADASNDVEGIDAAHKVAILSQLAFHQPVVSPRITRTGIIRVDRNDVARAHIAGLRIRLIGAAVRTRRGIAAEVGPVLLDAHHEFARTRDVDNVVCVQARDAGTLHLRGPGAGGAATASAVLGDVVTTLQTIAGRRCAITSRESRVLAPAVDVTPLFASLARLPEFPRYQLWDDSILQAPASRESAFSWPGKD